MADQEEEEGKRHSAAGNKAQDENIVDDQEEEEKSSRWSGFSSAINSAKRHASMTKSQLTPQFQQLKTKG